MSSLLSVLSFVLFVLLVIGLISPKLLSFIKISPTRKKVLIFVGIPFLIISILGGITGKTSLALPHKNESANSADNADSAEIAIKYKTYISNSDSLVSHLSKEQRANRDAIYSRLKASRMYKKLIDSSQTSMEYMPFLNVIANGISHISKLGFSMDKDIVTRVKDEQDFFASTLALLEPANGGSVPFEIIELFERYKNKYRIYAEKGMWSDANGNQSTIEYDYDLSPFFAMIDPKNPDVLNSVYEAKQKGLSNWCKANTTNTTNPLNPLYPYLFSKAEYMAYIKDVYPESPYLLKIDAEITASDLYRAYSSNEVAADEKYKSKKLAVTGVIENISKDALNDPFISLEIGYLKTVNCYFSDKDTKVISQLSKGQNITIVGECNGLKGSIVMLNEC